VAADAPVDPPRLAAWSLGGFSLTLLGLLIAFYYPFLSGEKSFYLSDLTYYYEPFSRFIGEALAHNRLPLWNPYCYCGMAQIALPVPGVFYPPNWIFAAIEYNRGLAILLIVHQWLAGLGGYLVVRLWRWHFAAAWLCGLVLALCGYMAGFQANYSLPATAAWAPLCWWSLARIRSGGDDTNLLFAALTSLLVSFLIASGRPELYSLVLLLLGLYVAVSFAIDMRAGNQAAGALFWRLLSLGTAALIAMPTVLPVREWATLSPRAAGMTANEVFLWSANWYDFLCLCVSQPLGDLYIRGSKYVALASSRAGYLPYLTSAFVGPVVLTLALWGALDRSWRWRSLCLATLLVGIVATLGNRTFIFPALLGAVPMLSMFRYPIKLMILPVWCLAILAARGTGLILQSSLSAGAIAAAAACWALLLAASLAFFLSPDLLMKLVQHSSNQALLPTDVYVTGQALIARAALTSGALGLAMCAGAWASRRWKWTNVATATLLLIATGATLLWHAFSYGRQGTDAGYYAKQSYVREQLAKLLPANTGLFSGQTRLLPLYFDPLVCPASYNAKGLGSQTPYFYQYGRQLLLPNTNVDAKLAGAYGYEAAITSDYRRIYHAVRNKSAPVAVAGKQVPTPSASSTANDLALSTFCRMTSTEIVLTQCFGSGSNPQDIPLLSSKLFDKILEDRAMNVRAYRVKGYLPRAYVARAWTLVGSHQAAVDQVSHPDGSGFDPGEKTLVEPHVVLGYAPKPGEIDKDELERSWVKFLEDLPEHVSLSVKAEQDSLIVLADHYYPGWNARVDNFPVDIHRANALQRAVFVRAGSHLLEFDYQPESLQTAFNCTNFGLTILLGIVLFVGARKFWRLAKGQSRGW